jgi:hypothetical protein
VERWQLLCEEDVDEVEIEAKHLEVQEVVVESSPLQKAVAIKWVFDEDPVKREVLGDE